MKLFKFSSTSGSKSATSVGIILCLLAVQVAGCKAKPEPTSSDSQPAGSGSAPGVGSLSSAGPLKKADGTKPPVGIPLDPEKVAKVLNPRNQKPYAGPTGSVEGIVHLKQEKGANILDMPGDKPPVRCGEALEMYGKAIRVGASGTLADAIVGVTGYKEFLPAKKEQRLVRIHGCSYESRNITMTFGQRLEVANTDNDVYLPHLIGARNVALMMAIPRANPVKIYPPLPGRYVLVDDLKHPWMKANVLVLKFSTHTVTGISGRYKIDGLPPGKMKVGMQHPSIKGDIVKDVVITANHTTTVDFELPYTKSTVVLREPDVKDRQIH
jgi:hypothetical protein